jgi:N6-adenosine-specific RNA methylase IME4
MGVGSYWRPEHEHLLLGVRKGTQKHFDDHSIGSIIRQRRTPRHSEKPAVHQMIERAIVGPYLELFARRSVPGWTVCGNQLDLTDSGNRSMVAE